MQEEGARQHGGRLLQCGEGGPGTPSGVVSVGHSGHPCRPPSPGLPDLPAVKARARWGTERRWCGQAVLQRTCLFRC